MPVIEKEHLQIDTTPAELRSTSGKSKYDKIIKNNGEIIRCIITDKNIYEITYINPKTNKMSTLNVNSVKEVKYSSGKSELMDKSPEKAPKDWVIKSGDSEWQNVKITYQQSDVESMVEKGPVDAFFEATKLDVTTETLERSANVMLKKKAVKLGATIIYISTKHVNKTYGEMPSIDIKGVAYGLQ